MNVKNFKKNKMKKRSISNLFDSKNINNADQIVGGLNYTAVGTDTAVGVGGYDITFESYDAQGYPIGSDTESSGMSTKDQPVVPSGR